MIKLLALLALVLFCAYSSAQTCDQCEYVAATVKTLLSNNATVQEIEAKLLSFCAMFPPPDNSKCVVLIQAKLPEIILLLQQYDDPAQLCTVLGFCTASKKVQKVSADECPLCTYLVGLAETWVTENATEERILNVLESACNILPGNAKETCHAAVEQYGREVIQLLVAKEDPTKICQLLGACPQRVLKAGPVPCFLCKYVAQTLEAFVTKNTTEAELLKLADKVCGVLPSKYRSSCASLVQVYLPQVIQLLLQKENPEVICQALSLCSSNFRQENVVVRKKLPATAQNCQLCQFLLMTLEGYATGNTTAEALLKYADAFCAKLGPLSPSCASFAANEIPQLLQYIVNKANPLTVCTKAGLCPGARKTYKKHKTGVISK